MDIFNIQYFLAEKKLFQYIIVSSMSNISGFQALFDLNRKILHLTLQGLGGGGVQRTPPCYKICNNFLITCSFALKFYDFS